MIHSAKFYLYLFENQIDNLKVPQDILYLLIDLVRLRSFSLSKLLLVTNVPKHYYDYITIISRSMEVKIPPKVTTNAFKKILAIGGKKCLRVAVEGGGCSGFKYEISMDSDIKDDDIILSENNCKVIIDPISLGFLSGAIIDFKEELIGSKFVIENPNATSSCGCGTSFSI